MTTPTNHLERIAEVKAGRTGAKVGYPIRIRELTVLRVTQLHRSMVRLTLGGDGAAGFESHVPVEHVRLIFPDPDTGRVRLPEENERLQLTWPRPHPPSREYTVRRFDPAALELDIDLVIHDGGLASDWARAASPGDRIHVAGPPGGLVISDHYDRYLLAGDLTALPAIARWLERMPDSAAGWAYLEVADEGEELPLRAPAGVDVRWLHRNGDAGTLERAVRATPIPAGASLFVWLAGEADAIKPLRGWVRDELGVGPSDSAITGYWKRGQADFDDEPH